MRVNTRWSKGKPRSVDDVASVLAFNAWRIACNGVLNLENEGFQTDTQHQRLTVIGEFLVFLVHSADRRVYGHMDDERRRTLIQSLAGYLMTTWEDNARDASDKVPSRAEFVVRLNQGMDEYADLPFTEEGPGFSYLRLFAEHVASAMGPRDNRWILEQVMDIEAPEAIDVLDKLLQTLTPDLPTPSR